MDLPNFPSIKLFSISVARMRMCVMHMFVLVLFQYTFIKIYFESITYFPILFVGVTCMLFEVMDICIYGSC